MLGTGCAVGERILLGLPFAILLHFHQLLQSVAETSANSK
jgi:hypothetical protein